MAKLSELTLGFMESFLKNNPTATTDSNGYSREDYQNEIKRRAEYVPPPEIKLNRDEMPQFRCLADIGGEDIQPPQGEPDNFEKVWPPTPENIGLF